MSLNIRKHYTEDSTVINSDTYDRLQFEHMVKAASKLEESVEKLAKENLSNISLMGDIWSSLYKVKPTIKSDSIDQTEKILSGGDILEQLLEQEGLRETSPSKTINEEFMRRILQDENYLKMHSTTKLDEFASSLGSMRLGEVITEWNQKQREEDEKYNEQMNELKQLNKQIQTNNNAMEKRLDNGQNPTKKQIDKQAKLQESVNSIQEKLAGQINQKLGDSQLSDMIKQAAEQTNQDKDNVKSLLGGAGNGDAELKKLPLGEQLQLAHIMRENEKVRSIAEWAGKLKAIARKKQKAKHTDSIDRSGMTLGNDLERLLPQELIQFVKNGTRLDFLRRFAENQTMMYSPKGKEVLGKGPIVVCLDESGSMNPIINEAKGFTLALAMIAKKQRRDFCVIPFSTTTGNGVVCAKGKVTTEHVLQLANNFLGGGTRYMPVLNEAVEYIQNQKRFKQADIIFVTDGDPSDTGAIKKELPLFLELKNRHSIKVMSLLIGDDPNEEFAKQFSDVVIRSECFHSEAAADLFSI